MNKYLGMEEFIDHFGNETKYSESSIHDSISMLCEKGFLEQIKPDPDDQRVNSVRPTPSVQKQLVEMGLE